MKIDLIAGARPNFMKIAPIINAIKKAQQKGKNNLLPSYSYRSALRPQHEW